MSKQELKDTLAIRRHIDTNLANVKDQVVSINRVTKVVKGGKNLSFSALVVVGDQHGHAGFGTVTRAQVEEIAKTKLKDLTAADLAAAVNTVSGTARSMGIDITE